MLRAAFKSASRRNLFFVSSAWIGFELEKSLLFSEERLACLLSAKFSIRNFKKQKWDQLDYASYNSPFQRTIDLLDLEISEYLSDSTIIFSIYGNNSFQEFALLIDQLIVQKVIEGPKEPLDLFAQYSTADKTDLEDSIDYFPFTNLLLIFFILLGSSFCLSSSSILLIRFLIYKLNTHRHSPWFQNRIYEMVDIFNN